MPEPITAGTRDHHAPVTRVAGIVALALAAGAVAFIGACGVDWLCERMGVGE